MLFPQSPKKIVERDGVMIELGTELRVVEALETIVAELAGLGETMIIISQQLADLQDRI